MSEIILALPVFFPILSGVAMLLRGLGKEEWSRKRELFIESLVTANSLLVAMAIAGGVDGDRRLVLFRLYSELTIMFKLDRMGSVFAGLVAFLWPLATLYAFEYMKHEERKSTFFAFYTITYGITMGIALAGNLVTLYLFYEMLTLVTLPLVLFPLTTEAVRAGRTYLYYSIGGLCLCGPGVCAGIFGSGDNGVCGRRDAEPCEGRGEEGCFVDRLRAGLFRLWGESGSVSLLPVAAQSRCRADPCDSPAPRGGSGKVRRFRYFAAHLFQLRHPVFKGNLGPVGSNGGGSGDHRVRVHHGG